MTEFMRTCAESSRRNGRAAEANVWSKRLDLRRLPTKPADLNIKMEGPNRLIVSGKSEVTNDENGFSIFSTHVWSKEIEIPEKVQKASVKAKLGEGNQLTITGDFE